MSATPVNLALAEELFPAVERALGWFMRHLDSDGLLREVPHWLFVDWATAWTGAARTRCSNAHFPHILETSIELAQMTEALRQARA